MRRLLSGKLMDEVAIERLRGFEKQALSMNPTGYYLAYSGGKDSEVILHLTQRSGVKFTAHHNLTTVDPPELVYHVRTKPVEIHKPPITMWQLIRKMKMPPRRQARYCCKVLKEGGGADSMVITGVRWGESNRRSKRQMVEACYRSKARKYLHPIIDWKTADVWEYIRENEIEYCKLYDEGFKRLGCVLCPMTRNTAEQIERWPRIARAWESAVKATFDPDKTKKHTFSTPEEYWQWWLDRDASSKKKDEHQFVLFEDDPDRAEKKGE